MNWISDYAVKNERDGTRIITGNFSASAGSFVVEYCGDGGNSDEYKITLSGVQFETDGKPTVITIVGCWEFNELAALVNLVKQINDHKH